MEDIKKRLEDAQDAVRNLDEPFKTMAFQKILNNMFPEQESTSPTAKSKKPSKRTGLSKEGPARKREDEETQKMVESVNRTEYPKMKNLDKTLDMALYTLKIMEEKGYKNLTPSQIKEVLSVFRKKVNVPAISMALLKADEYVDRVKAIHKGAVSYKYYLVDKGEDYIQKVLESNARKSDDNSEK
jgi:hypothetical protein